MRYTGEQNSITVGLVKEWSRGEIALPVMSASSGPKDYLKNQIFAAFESDRDLEKIMLVVGEYQRSAPFALFFKAGSWRDAAGRCVEVQ